MHKYTQTQTAALKPDETELLLSRLVRPTQDLDGFVAILGFPSCLSHRHHGLWSTPPPQRSRVPKLHSTLLPHVRIPNSRAHFPNCCSGAGQMQPTEPNLRAVSFPRVALTGALPPRYPAATGWLCLAAVSPDANHWNVFYVPAPLPGLPGGRLWQCLASEALGGISWGTEVPSTCESLSSFWKHLSYVHLILFVGLKAQGLHLEWLILCVAYCMDLRCSGNSFAVSCKEWVLSCRSEHTHTALRTRILLEVCNFVVFIYPWFWYLEVHTKIHTSQLTKSFKGSSWVESGRREFPS